MAEDPTAVLTEDDVLVALRAAVSRVLERDPGSVLPAQRFAEDLDADSLARVEIAELFEEGLAERGVVFRIADADLDGLETVGQTLAYAMRSLRSPRTPRPRGTTRAGAA